MNMNRMKIKLINTVKDIITMLVLSFSATKREKAIKNDKQYIPHTFDFLILITMALIGLIVGGTIIYAYLPIVQEIHKDFTLSTYDSYELEVNIAFAQRMDFSMSSSSESSVVVSLFRILDPIFAYSFNNVSTVEISWIAKMTAEYKLSIFLNQSVSDDYQFSIYIEIHSRTDKSISTGLIIFTLLILPLGMNYKYYFTKKYILNKRQEEKYKL